MQACPVGALKGAHWKRGTGMEELVDVGLCTKQVNANQRLSGRYICGRCTDACPLGAKAGTDGQE